MQYNAVKNYLMTYSTVEPPYDFHGLLRLVLAGVENLRVSALDHEIVDYAFAITDEQAVFLRRLLDSRAREHRSA